MPTAPFSRSPRIPLPPALRLRNLQQEIELVQSQLIYAGEIPVERLTLNPYRVRTTVEQEAIDSLAKSVAEIGLLQPIVVHRNPEVAGWYQIVIGERRWLACQKLGKKTIPAEVVEAKDEDMALLSFAENYLREPLTDREVYLALKDSRDSSE